MTLLLTLAAHRSRSWLTALLLCLAGIAAQAQTCALPGWDGPATASGVVNSYHGGSGSPAAGATSVTVASASGLRSNTRSLRVGDLVLIMQMQDSSSGGNAGLHEYAQITAITGTTLSLNRPLTNSYNQTMSTSAVRNWQVVWVPQYSALSITGTVSADAWTSNTSTGVVSGGVIAMDVAGGLTLTGTISAAGSGFRGAYGLAGSNALPGGTVTTANSSFTPTAVYGGQKGEGIQGTPPVVFQGTATPLSYLALLGQGYALGAGGQAAIGNAGGAANDGAPPNTTDPNQYNSGGGGGGNAGAGGQGGNSWNGNTTAANLNQGTTTNIGNVAGGKGGNAQTNAATRLVLGGGGGSGSANNATVADGVTAWPPSASSVAANGATGPVTSSGASGGGAVLLRAGSLTGNGTVDASGYRAYNKAPVGDTDAAGGGGAGGSIFMTSASGAGTGVTLRAAGGEGGSSNYFNHGPGGGGGGGYILTNLTGATLNVAGGANGTDGCCSGSAGNGSPKAWNSTAGAGGVASTAGGSAAGVQGGAACLPVVSVVKSTITPTVTAATGASAVYQVNLSNSGGAASNVFMIDATLPPGWTYSGAGPTFVSYNPAPPAAANSPAAGAESVSAAAPGALPASSVASANSGTFVGLRSAASMPGVTPTNGNNTVTFGSFYLPQNGSITVSFVASIPDTATAGNYHNPAGVIFLDPTRTTSAVRMVSPAVNTTANRAGIGYSANTTYASGATTNVGGANYSGLAAGPTGEDVLLLPDLSVTKSLGTATFTVGGTSTYVLVGRNNGRPVADQVYANTQATGQSATAIVSSAPAVTDTLPAGMTMTAVTNSNPAVWTCSPNATSVTFTCTAGSAVYPMAAASNIVTITATVAVSAQACPGPRTNIAVITTPAVGDAQPSNNTGTVTTPIGCGANLTVTKTNGGSSVNAGGTTSYTLTFANLGPAAADGSTIADSAGAGLSCSVASCTASGTGVCPAAGLWPNLLGAGLTLPAFASGATLGFQVSCGITASGQ